MKIYNVTRWLKVPVTIMVEGEKELEVVKAADGEQFISHFYYNTELDEREAYWEGTSYEQIGEQEVEFVDEDEREESV